MVKRGDLKTICKMIYFLQNTLLCEKKAKINKVFIYVIVKTV